MRPTSIRPRAGFTLVELLVVMVILAVTLGEVTRSLLNVSHLEPVQRETAAALDAARATLEELRSLPFEDIVALYDEDPNNDPDGVGSAPGPNFAVVGLSPREGDPDGFPGAVELPLLAGSLREDYADVELGCPRDLNSDGAIDAADHIADYAVLPVRVRVTWEGEGGDRTIELVTTLCPGL